jgi:hypothetical protein
MALVPKETFRVDCHGFVTAVNKDVADMCGANIDKMNNLSNSSSATSRQVLQRVSASELVPVITAVHGIEVGKRLSIMLEHAVSSSSPQDASDTILCSVLRSEVSKRISKSVLTMRVYLTEDNNTVFDCSMLSLSAQLQFPVAYVVMGVTSAVGAGAVALSTLTHKKAVPLALLALAAGGALVISALGRSMPTYIEDAMDAMIVQELKIQELLEEDESEPQLLRVLSTGRNLK